MSTLAPEQSAGPAASKRAPDVAIVALWFGALVPLLIGLGTAPVLRTQEARVLETARQMLGRGFHAWLIPSLNGEIRLRKPPLAYWLAAGSFTVFGVGEAAGRLPTVLLAWLTVGVTYLIANRLFGRRAGLISAACLLVSYLFFKMGRLAETDGPAAFGATVAAGLFWQCLDLDTPLLFHAAAVATGLSLFAKQGPGVFSLLFFVTLCLLQRRPEVLRRFLRSGAPLTLIVVAGWWYGYAAASRGIVQFRREVSEVTEGIDHFAPFYAYIPMLALSAAPWTILLIGAVVAAAKRARHDQRLLGLLVWMAAVFVPLCFIGNKQEHYLLPMMPPAMILVGWLIHEATRGGAEPKLAGAVAALIGLTIFLSIAAPFVVLGAARFYRGYLTPLDFTLAVFLLVASVMAWVVLKNISAIGGWLTLACIWGLAFPLLLGVWGPTVSGTDIRAYAGEITRRFGAGPYAFYGGDTSLPLCYAMRRQIPRIDDKRPDLLWQAALQSPTLAVIWEIPQPGDRQTRLPPPGFEPVGPDVGAKGQHFRIYQIKSVHE
jgi:4-amino-4-deoxy-L-arabinose transferase-like glycosyltransferase